MTANRQQRITLAMYPNTFGVGFVICEGPKEILDYGIKKVQPISHYKYMKKVKWLFEYCKPDIVLLLDYKSRKISKRQKRIIDAILQLARAQNLQLKTYSRSQIKQTFLSFQAKTKYEIAMMVLSWYPELKEKAPHKRLPWMAEHYQMGLFDAFALMLTHYYLEE
ncbi:hypothetical protein [Polaribacter sp. Hel_I_88]|uniref:hypothetical protein n=1 Tax=Polaribacter sp. Hel_I_88 TaxID=1250006 RepID=UPI00047C0010|nr:hypothetical protein [Polaribacter sp. Hel_I_88]